MVSKFFFLIMQRLNKKRPFLNKIGYGSTNNSFVEFSEQDVRCFIKNIVRQKRYL